MNERIKNMRKSVNALNDAGVRRTLFYPLAYTSLKETCGEKVELRRAKAQAYIMDHAPLAVLPHELLAGSMVGICPVFEDVLSYEAQQHEAEHVIQSFLDKKRENAADERKDRNRIKTFEADFTGKESRWALMSRVFHDASITYQDLQQLITDMTSRFSDEPDIEKYEIGRELERSFKIDYGQEVKREIDTLPWFAANHLSLNYAALMSKGFAALISDIRDKRKTAQGEKRTYYEAALITAQAASRFFGRYAMALLDESDGQMPKRKAELQQMAQICERLAVHPAASFREGLQFVWMLHIIASILWGSALSFGRFDQYMYELFDKDIRRGAISHEEAKELLCCMWLKVNEPRMRTVQSMTIGGVTPDGEDAANALTRLCLDVINQMKLPYPNVGVRIGDKNPQWLFDDVTASVCQGSGQPMIMADKVWVENLKRLGYPDHIANDYYNMGCVEIMIPGKQPNWGVTDPIAFPMLYESMFEKYRTGELALDTFDDFKLAYTQELRSAVDADKREADAKIADIPGKCYDPFASLMIDGCLEAGADMFQGGSEIGTHWSFYAYGLGTAADAMAAVKKFVYDEVQMSIGDMAEMLQNNFNGYERTLMMLKEKTPHYGNDNDEVDELANYILSTFNRMVFELNNSADSNKYVSTLFGYFFHIYHGEITDATPDGRKRGEAFSDSMGPSQGKDISGPTSMLNSVLKLAHGHVTGGYALNLKINPANVREAAGRKALGALIKAYVEDGGPQMQINFVDKQTLMKAQHEPEKYRNLIVRIGGYCEYFVNLDRSLQNEIIERTIHGL